MLFRSTSPSFPAQNKVEQDGSGTITQNKPAVRNPIDVDFPSINKLSINDAIQAAPQMVERAFSIIKDIAGPVAKTLGTEIAGAAQGAAQAIQGVAPKLEALVPKVSELADNIQPSLKSLGFTGENASAAAAKMQQSIGSGLGQLNSALSALPGQINTAVSEAQAKLNDPATQAQIGRAHV